jgi:hypothetical protein
MSELRQGQPCLFHPKKGKPKEAIFGVAMGNGLCEIRVGSDPFPVTVQQSQVSGCEATGKNVKSNPKVRKDRTSKKGKHKMTASTAEKPSAKELRKQAQGLGIKGWEEMGRKELAKAIRKVSKNGKAPKAEAAEVPAKKKSKKGKSAKAKTAPVSKPKAKSTKPKASKPKAAPAKKAAKAEKADTGEGLTFAKSHPKPTPEHGVNPFRKNSNLFRVAKLLLKGGRRETLASKLSEQTTLHPYQKGDNEVELLDYDKRLLLGAQTMRDQYGYGIQRTGRGLSGSILVFVPGGPNDPRGKKSSKKATKKK